MVPACELTSDDQRPSCTRRWRGPRYRRSSEALTTMPDNLSALRGVTKLLALFTADTLCHCQLSRGVCSDTRGAWQERAQRLVRRIDAKHLIRIRQRRSPITAHVARIVCASIINENRSATFDVETLFRFRVVNKARSGGVELPHLKLRLAPTFRERRLRVGRGTFVLCVNSVGITTPNALAVAVEEEATAPHKRRIVVEPYPHYKKEAQAIKKLIEDSLCGNDDHPWNWNHEMSGINNLIKKAKRLFSGFKPVHDWKKINTLEKKAWLEHHGPRGHKTLEDAGWEQTGEGWWSRWEQTGEGWKNLHTDKVRPLDFRSDPPGLGEDVDVIVRHLKTTTEDHLSKVKDKWVPMNSAERLLRRDGFYGSARGNQCRDHSAQYQRGEDNEVRLDELSLCIKEELWNYYWEKMLLTHTENKEDWDEWWTTHWKNEQEIAADKLEKFWRLDESTVMNKQQFVVLWNTEMARDALGPGIKAKNTEMRTKLSKLIQKSLLNEYPHHQKNKEDKKYWTDYWVKYLKPDQEKWEKELLQKHQEHILVMRKKMEALSRNWSDYIPSQKKQLQELEKSVKQGREIIEMEKREDKRERWVDMLVRLGMADDDL